jgi:hypothetical protein
MTLEDKHGGVEGYNLYLELFTQLGKYIKQEAQIFIL